MPDTQTLPKPDCAEKAPIERLKKRPEFLAAARDCSWATPGLVLQARNRRDQGAVRVGFTVTKKVGNAVERNRIKRRLREAVRLAQLPEESKGKDAVLIARRDALHEPFDSLVAGVIHGLRSAKMPNKSRDKHKRRTRDVAKAQ